MCELLDEEQVREILEHHGKSEENLIAILLETQKLSHNNYVPEEWAQIIAGELNIPLSKVYEVLTFYAMLSVEPQGKFVIELCKSGACYLLDTETIVQIFESELGIKMGETTKDRTFTLKYTECVGACDIGPVAKVGESIYGNLSRARIRDIIRDLRREAEWQ